MSPQPNKRDTRMLQTATRGLAAILVLGACSGPLLADEGKALNRGHEYMVTTNYPNNLHILDLATDSLYKTCQMPDAFGPGTVQLSPDRTIAYVLNNHYADIYGVELDTCKQVFHASITQQPGKRPVQCFPSLSAMTVRSCTPSPTRHGCSTIAMKCSSRAWMSTPPTPA